MVRNQISIDTLDDPRRPRRAERLADRQFRRMLRGQAFSSRLAPASEAAGMQRPPGFGGGGATTEWLLQPAGAAPTLGYGSEQGRPSRTVPVARPLPISAISGSRPGSPPNFGGGRHGTAVEPATQLPLLPTPGNPASAYRTPPPFNPPPNNGGPGRSPVTDCDHAAGQTTRAAGGSPATGSSSARHAGGSARVLVGRQGSSWVGWPLSSRSV